jgi:hypothetical protein
VHCAANARSAASCMFRNAESRPHSRACTGILFKSCLSGTVGKAKGRRRSGAWSAGTFSSSLRFRERSSVKSLHSRPHWHGKCARYSNAPQQAGENDPTRPGVDCLAMANRRG